MNINQVENPRMIIWMKKEGMTETPKHFGEYFAFINNAVIEYTKELKINHILDHEDFTNWLQNHV